MEMLVIELRRNATQIAEEEVNEMSHTHRMENSIHVKGSIVCETIDSTNEDVHFEWRAHWTMFTSLSRLWYASIISLWSQHRKRKKHKKPFIEYFFSSFFSLFDRP